VGTTTFMGRGRYRILDLAADLPAAAQASAMSLAVTVLRCTVATTVKPGSSGSGS